MTPAQVSEIISVETITQVKLVLFGEFILRLGHLGSLRIINTLM